MGYPRALRYACAVAAIAGLTACGQDDLQSDVATLNAEVASLRAEVAALRSADDEMKAQIDTVRAVAIAKAPSAPSATSRKAETQRLLNEMTDRAACGTKAYPVYDAEDPTRRVGRSIRAVPCTEADLR